MRFMFYEINEYVLKCIFVAHFNPNEQMKLKISLIDGHCVSTSGQFLLSRLGNSSTK